MDIKQTLLIFLVVFITFSISIGVYYAVTGILPWATTVIKVTEPPITSTGLDPKQLKFMFFYADWCPFSSAAVESWKSLKQDYKNNPSKYGNDKVVFEDVNGDTEKAKMAAYTVSKFPTFKIETNGKVYELGGQVTFSRLQTFLTSVIKNKPS